MRKHSVTIVPLKSVPPPVTRRRLGTRLVLFVGSVCATLAFVLVNIVDPYAGATAAPSFNAEMSLSGADGQHFVVAGVVDPPATAQDGFTVRRRIVAASIVRADPQAGASSPSPAQGSDGPPAAGTPSPGSAQAYARQLLQSQGMGEGQFACLVALWNRESHWNTYAYNAGSGAYGIPQALPGSKMASVGADWKTNFKTQITWGLQYISRYGSPCGAWRHSQATGWY
ncbi:MAG TPA: lytic transglycosylase domain-containing protein [Microbacteriaceae bacterium]|nr:lytic transglycosylase domain-containing protein [Microbacteriaceae bacterium]